MNQKSWDELWWEKRGAKQLVMTQDGHTYTKTEILAFVEPTQYCVTFIGGPENTKQVFYPIADARIRHGELFMALVPHGGVPQFQGLEYFCYKLFFLPTQDTLFTDCQMVIGIFQ